MERAPEPVIKEDPFERLIDWFVDATFEEVIKELLIANPQK
jgi:hypothetical protein